VRYRRTTSFFAASFPTYLQPRVSKSYPAATLYPPLTPRRGTGHPSAHPFYAAIDSWL
jgi:hypothetical protein